MWGGGFNIYAPVCNRPDCGSIYAPPVCDTPDAHWRLGLHAGQIGGPRGLEMVPRLEFAHSCFKPPCSLEVEPPCSTALYPMKFVKPCWLKTGGGPCWKQDAGLDRPLARPIKMVFVLLCASGFWCLLRRGISSDSRDGSTGSGKPKAGFFLVWKELFLLPRPSVSRAEGLSQAQGKAGREPAPLAGRRPQEQRLTSCFV